jgi:hypothetical protein
MVTLFFTQFSALRAAFYFPAAAADHPVAATTSVGHDTPCPITIANCNPSIAQCRSSSKPATLNRGLL